MSSKAPLTKTKIRPSQVDEAFASGDKEKLRSALYSLAQRITKDGHQLDGHINKDNHQRPVYVTKDDITATEFVMEHIWKSLPKYRVREGSRFSSWAYRVLSFRFRDWLRAQKIWHRKMSLVHGVDSQGKDGGEGESAEEHLERLCTNEIHTADGSGVHKAGSGAIPAYAKFGKRELREQRATKAIQMRDEGASNIEIAAHLSLGKKKAVKPSSVRTMLSRWRQEGIYF